MTDLGNKYAVAALRNKRAVLAGEIAKLEKTLEWKRHQLVHLDATLALFGEGDPDSIKPVKPYKRIALFKQGELSQHVRESLRRGGKPMLLSEVVESVVKELGTMKLLFRPCAIVFALRCNISGGSGSR
jgi:hypothetical protein